MEALRVEQAQAPEVPGTAELLRGGGEEQDTRGMGREVCHQIVGETGLGLGVMGGRWCPGQVVGLVHHQQVPVPGQGRPGRGGVAGEQVQTAQDALFGLEGVCAFHGGNALAVEQGQG